MRAALLVAALMLLPGALALSTPDAGLALDLARDAPRSIVAGRADDDGPLPEAEPADIENGYRVLFNCPVTDPLAIERPACPYRHADKEAAYGAPALAVDPLNPTRVLVAALVGKTVPDGSTRTTRAGEIVLLASENEGISFARTPVPAPAPGLRPEEVALVTDRAGRVALAALYSEGSGAAAKTTLAVWKLGTFPGLSNLSAPPTLLPIGTEGARHTRLSLAADAATGGLFAAWQEIGLAPDERSALGPAPYARLAWSTLDATSGWNATAPVGPCGDVTNALAVDGFAFFGCTIANGYLPDESALVGDLAFHRLEPETANLTYRSRLNFGGSALITLGPKGRIGVASVVVEAPERIRLFFSSGRHAENWSRPMDAGRELHNKSFGPVSSANIHALAFQPATEAYYLIYAERPQRAPEETELLSKPRERKFLVALDRIGQLLTRHSLATDREGARLAGEPDPARWREPIAEDTRDGMVSLMTRPFVVYSDAGTLVYGELTERDARDAGGLPETSPSEVPTDLSLEVDRKFTPQFILTGVLLAGLVVGRALLGRFQSNTIESEHGEE